MKSFILVFITSWFMYHLTFAQYQNVRVGAPINTYEPEEVSIVINPANTDHILAGSNTDNYYYSLDGGLNWQHNILTSSFGVIGDPCVLVDSDNNYYYLHLVPGLSRVVCQKTTSLGGSWTDGTYTGVNGTKDDDKEWGAINMLNNYIYVTWAQFDEHGSTSSQDSSEIQLSRSTDAGLSWSEPVRISDRNGNAMGGNYSAHAPMPAVGPNNEVYVTWMGPAGLMFDKSTDDGQTWLEADINVTGFHINWLLFNIAGIQRAPGFPVINCDLSPGSNYGNIYICWTDQRSGYNNTDVWLVKSTDGGLNWSVPIRVNNDQPGKHQFFAWMTIDQANGNLYFVFYDRRSYTDNQTDVYMAVSTDGGTSFNNFKISESPFSPTELDFIGDYIGVTAYDNIVRPVWTRVDNHQLSLWTAIVDNVVEVDEGNPKFTPSDFTLYQNYPNPFNPSAKIKFTIPQSPLPGGDGRGGLVTLKVYDVLGNEIATLVNEERPAGNYEVEFNANELPSSIYFYKLQAGDFIQTKKMVLLK
ncbi:T9SS type A sorting domain-containing protein [Bacteroidota bacterium]